MLTAKKIHDYQMVSLVRAGYCLCGAGLKPKMANICSQCAARLRDGEVLNNDKDDGG